MYISIDCKKADLMYKNSVRRAAEKLYAELEKNVHAWKRRKTICIDTYELGWLLRKEEKAMDEDISDCIGRLIVRQAV